MSLAFAVIQLSVPIPNENTYNIMQNNKRRDYHAVY